MHCFGFSFRTFFGKALASWLTAAIKLRKQTGLPIHSFDTFFFFGQDAGHWNAPDLSLETKKAGQPPPALSLLNGSFSLCLDRFGSHWDRKGLCAGSGSIGFFSYRAVLSVSWSMSSTRWLWELWPGTAAEESVEDSSGAGMPCDGGSWTLEAESAPRRHWSACASKKKSISLWNTQSKQPPPHPATPALRKHWALRPQWHCVS